MFSIGDIVRCTCGGIFGITLNQRFEIVRTKDWSDGSQSLWVRYVPKSKSTDRAAQGKYDETTIRGPYCHIRFEFEDRGLQSRFVYDPNQIGDREDDI